MEQEDGGEEQATAKSPLSVQNSSASRGTSQEHAILGLAFFNFFFEALGWGAPDIDTRGVAEDTLASDTVGYVPSWVDGSGMSPLPQWPAAFGYE